MHKERTKTVLYIISAFMKLKFPFSDFSPSVNQTLIRGLFLMLYEILWLKKRRINKSEL